MAGTHTHTSLSSYTSRTEKKKKSCSSRVWISIRSIKTPSHIAHVQTLSPSNSHSTKSLISYISYFLYKSLIPTKLTNFYTRYQQTNKTRTQYHTHTLAQTQQQDRAREERLLQNPATDIEGLLQNPARDIEGLLQNPASDREDLFKIQQEI